jgi:inhibitor of Bruton tyrosine kinase
MFPALGSPIVNLADIIAQQTSEQKALSVKAVPRSLKEIQEEEQFLQWWEQESQRVKEEKELAARMTEMSIRDTRGRGQRGRGGRGRGSARGRGDGQLKGRADFGRGDAGQGHGHDRGK